MVYKTLEQQIQELWKSRGFVDIEEVFGPVKGEKGTYRWTIIATAKDEVS